MHNETKDFLDSIRKDAYKNFIPVMRPKTSELLCDLVEKTNPKQALEIGTSLGVSAISLLDSSQAILTTIEINDDVQIKAKENLKKLNLNNRCKFLLGDCHEIVNMMSGINKYDFIVLDGPKGHYCELYELLVPMLNFGGILFIDDVHYHNKVLSNKAPEKKHRTIVVNLRKLLKRVRNDKRIKATEYQIEDGVLVIEKVKEDEES